MRGDKDTTAQGVTQGTGMLIAAKPSEPGPVAYSPPVPQVVPPSCPASLEDAPEIEALGILRGYERAVRDHAYDFASGAKRTEDLNVLHGIGTRTPLFLNDAARLAFQIQAGAKNYDAIEAMEDERLHRLHATLQTDLAIATRRWARLNAYERIDFASLVMQSQALAFGTRMPDEIVAFSLSKAEHKARFAYFQSPVFPQACTLRGPIDPRSGIRTRGGIAVAFNLHADAGNYLEDPVEAVATGVHEQGHVQHTDLFRVILKQGHPYLDFKPGLEIQRSKWETDSPLSDIFYRAALHERHAHAIDQKFRRLMRGQKAWPERFIFARAMTDLNQPARIPLPATP
ncbi:MAG: hypothetical protein H6865_02205 [Rhodospirillales bacterium]|nr:hypothetical protein [Alphaproteobacteria bacterium]MCB9986427.1 hypothetical protein [Rhodospirillales bacterium]USO07027.1 MAG: hypothetical protein H6866_06180 [Rhodospirillales bacterium]